MDIKDTGAKDSELRASIDGTIASADNTSPILNQDTDFDDGEDIEDFD